MNPTTQTQAQAQTAVPVPRFVTAALEWIAAYSDDKIAAQRAKDVLRALAAESPAYPQTAARNTRDPMTPRQEAVLKAIIDYRAARGFSPTIRDLCRIMDIRSPNGIMVHIKALQTKGYLQRDPNLSRTLIPI